MFADRLDDQLMLLLDAFEIALLQLALVVEGADALARNDQPTEKFQETDEARILCADGDGEMEIEIFLDRAVALDDGAGEDVGGFGDCPDLRGAGAFAGDGGGF